MLVAAIVVVLVGRWERQRSIDVQVRGMKRVERLVGPFDQPALSGYRRLPGLDCLVYRRGSNVFALELCFDPAGRLVEAIDRRHAERHIYSLRYEPASSPVRVARAEVDRLLRRMHAPRV
jgi:hypothetical protein